MGTRVLVLVGTKKGGFILDSDEGRRQWSMKGPFCQHGVLDMKYDPATRAIYTAGTAGNWPDFKPVVWKSTDLGETWTHSGEGLTYGEGGPKMNKVWHIMPAHGSLYAGVDPAGLFRSDDGGQTWHHVTGLTNHPTRPEWGGGAGGLCLHSIVPHPTDPKQMWLGISAVGTMYTADGGETWEVRNKGMSGDYLADADAEIGY